MAAHIELLPETEYSKTVRARVEQHSERRQIGSIDFNDEGVGLGIGLMDSIFDRSQIEEEAVRAHRRLVRDFRPDFSQDHVIDSVDRMVRAVSRRFKPEQLYVTAFLTAVELQSILRRIYY